MKTGVECPFLPCSVFIVFLLFFACSCFALAMQLDYAT